METRMKQLEEKIDLLQAAVDQKPPDSCSAALISKISSLFSCYRKCSAADSGKFVSEETPSEAGKEGNGEQSAGGGEWKVKKCGGEESCAREQGHTTSPSERVKYGV
jgi:hypothetical protein